jgi:hypothetical protein
MALSWVETRRKNENCAFNLENLVEFEWEVWCVILCSISNNKSVIVIIIIIIIIIVVLF